MIQGPAHFYLFSKANSDETSLKDMLQFLRSKAPGKTLQFAYVETNSSLIPHLSLWENLHVVLGGSSWKEFTAKLESEWSPLINLIQDPNLKASDASPWERLIVALLKGTLIQAQHILIDMNEDLHSPLNLSNFKKVLVHMAQQKNIMIATSQPAIWKDAATAVISRQGYEFIIEDLKAAPVKRRSA